MRISFDLDGTLIRYGDDVVCEPRLPLLLRLFINDEPLRSGASRLAQELIDRGHELWIYTTSHRQPTKVRRWLRAHGIRVERVINGAEHATCFGLGSTPTKRPHAFAIDLQSMIQKASLSKESSMDFESAWLSRQLSIGSNLY